MFHMCFFSCKKNDNNKNNHFTTCRCAMLCCAVLWYVSVGPRRFEAGWKPPDQFHSPPPINFIAPPSISYAPVSIS